MPLIAILGAITIAMTAIAQTSSPQVPKKPVVDHYFETSVVDDYRWLEDAQSAETKEWVKAQNIQARTFLDGLSDRPAILVAKTAMESHGHVAYFGLSQRNGKYFALKYAPPLEQPILVTLSNPDDLSTERIIVNPNELDPSGGTSISRYSPSPDGSKIAVCWSSDNSEFGMPDVCVNKCAIVILSHAGGESGMYFLTGSSTFNLPRSSNNRIEAAVNCFVSEPRRNLVSGEFGIFHSRFAKPYPLLRTTTPSCAIKTDPMKSWRATLA